MNPFPGVDDTVTIGELGRRIDGMHIDLKEDISFIREDLSTDISEIRRELDQRRKADQIRDNEIGSLRGKVNVILAGVPVGAVVFGALLHFLVGAAV